MVTEVFQKKMLWVEKGWRKVLKKIDGAFEHVCKNGHWCHGESAIQPCVIQIKKPDLCSSCPFNPYLFEKVVFRIFAPFFSGEIPVIPLPFSPYLPSVPWSSDNRDFLPIIYGEQLVQPWLSTGPQPKVVTVCFIRNDVALDTLSFYLLLQVPTAGP